MKISYRLERDGRVLVLDFTSPGDADDAAEAAAVVRLSHRNTTSSRRPGRAIEGTVRTTAPRLVKCLDCGHHRYNLGGAHSPHWRDGVLVDCVGREVKR